MFFFWFLSIIKQYKQQQQKKTLLSFVDGTKAGAGLDLVHVLAGSFLTFGLKAEFLFHVYILTTEIRAENPGAF